ncbi:MAG: protein translocase subunit secF [Magnetococcales bacterium]|nr:protein translocase subunit secF [Magnetococcales bacterium]HIJ84741.1 protein translocase subunit SecF [Magnetococcales bacterium]
MEMISTKIHIDFIRIRWYAFLFSGLMILASVVSLATQGLNPGIDFSGGTLVQVRFKTPPSLHQIRGAMATLGLGDVVIQEFGTREEIIIRVEKQEVKDGKPAELAERVTKALEPLAGGEPVELRRVEFVGPQVGAELVEKGFLALGYSIVAILIYVAWRFELRFSYGAILALIHDAFVTMGLMSILQKEFTLVIVAAILTLIGYSINDTIVVYDRIREEMRKRKKQDMAEVINIAINQTLSRTIITSGTVLLVLLALLLFGGEVIHDFSLALFFGIVVGTYSSIFVASPIVLFFEKNTQRDPAAGPKKKDAIA